MNKKKMFGFLIFVFLHRLLFGQIIDGDSSTIMPVSQGVESKIRPSGSQQLIGVGAIIVDENNAHSTISVETDDGVFVISTLHATVNNTPGQIPKELSMLDESLIQCLTYKGGYFITANIQMPALTEQDVVNINLEKFLEYLQQYGGTIRIVNDQATNGEVVYTINYTSNGIFLEKYIDDDSQYHSLYKIDKDNISELINSMLKADPDISSIIEGLMASGNMQEKSYINDSGVFIRDFYNSENNRRRHEERSVKQKGTNKSETIVYKEWEGEELMKDGELILTYSQGRTPGGEKRFILQAVKGYEVQPQEGIRREFSLPLLFFMDMGTYGGKYKSFFFYQDKDIETGDIKECGIMGISEDGIGEVISVIPQSDGTYKLKRPFYSKSTLLNELLTYLNGYGVTEKDGRITIDINPLIAKVLEIANLDSSAINDQSNLIGQFVSVWNNYLDVMEAELKRAGYSVERSDGDYVPVVTVSSGNYSFNTILTVKKEAPNEILIKEYSENSEYLGSKRITFDRDISAVPMAFLLNYLYGYDFTFNTAVAPILEYNSNYYTVTQIEFGDTLGNPIYTKSFDSKKRNVKEIKVYSDGKKINLTPMEGGKFSVASGEGAQEYEYEKYFAETILLQDNIISYLNTFQSIYTNVGSPDNWNDFVNSAGDRYSIKKQYFKKSTYYKFSYNSDQDQDMPLLGIYLNKDDGSFQGLEVFLYPYGNSKCSSKLLIYNKDGKVWIKLVSDGTNYYYQSEIDWKFSNPGDILDLLTKRISEFSYVYATSNSPEVVKPGVYMLPEQGNGSESTSSSLTSVLKNTMDALLAYYSILRFRETLDDIPLPPGTGSKGWFSKIYDSFSAEIFKAIATVGGIIAKLGQNLNSKEEIDKGTLFSIVKNDFFFVHSSVGIDQKGGTVVDFSNPFFKKFQFDNEEDFKAWIDGLIGDQFDSSHLAYKDSFYDFVWNTYQFNDTLAFYFFLRPELYPEYPYKIPNGGDISTYLPNWITRTYGCLSDEEFQREKEYYQNLLRTLTFPRAGDDWEMRDWQIGWKSQHFDFTIKHAIMLAGMALSFANPVLVNSVISEIVGGVLGEGITASVMSKFLIASIGAFRGATSFIPFTAMMQTGQGMSFIDWLNALDDQYINNVIYSFLFGLLFNPSWLGIEMEAGNFFAYPIKKVGDVLGHIPRLGKLATVFDKIAWTLSYGDRVSRWFLTRFSRGSSKGLPALNNPGFWLYTYVGESLMEEELLPNAMEYGIKQHGTTLYPHAPTLSNPLGDKSIKALARAMLRSTETFGNFAEFTDPLESPIGLLLLPSIIGDASQHSFIDLLLLQNTN